MYKDHKNVLFYISTNISIVVAQSGQSNYLQSFSKMGNSLWKYSLWGNNSDDSDNRVTPLQFLYIETKAQDSQPIKYDRLVQFVLKYQVAHVAIGLISPSSAAFNAICGVQQKALFIQNFFLKLPAGVKVSAHPYDGFEDPRWPFTYKDLSGRKAIMRYVKEFNQLLIALKSKVIFSGLVFGEGLGGATDDKDPQDYKKTVVQFRGLMKDEGLQNLTLGASPGGPNLGLDESYFQIYDLAYNDQKNPNLWDINKNNVAGFFDSVLEGNGGWKGDDNIPSWCELRNFYKDDLKLWEWEVPNPNVQRKHYMWAFQVPDRDESKFQKRLNAWSEDGAIAFFTHIQRQMNRGKSGFFNGLYFDLGLQYFA